ncbi:MAG: riboflavin biosynthesis protein RibF [Planctomycetes bacterium]|nr:riboflavin biosynthesis protein RibF [Planctomycetota bacterium]
MRTIQGTDGLSPERFRRPVVTIGVFDGVHRGHRAVLARTREIAARTGGEVVVITFHVHPRAVTRGTAPPLITSLPHRLLLLAREGVDTTVVLHFDAALREMSAERFVEDVLVAGIGVRGVVVGHDTHFGHDRRGGFDLLRDLLGPRGVPVERAEAVRLQDGVVVSSSAIREAVASGNLAHSERLLGRPPALFGTVVRGDGRGRQLGFPTANLDLDGELRPGRGVYGAATEIDGRTWAAVVNIGGRPTFLPEGADEAVEVHVPGWSGDLYDKPLEVFVLGKIRDERKFEGAAALREQMTGDIATLHERLRTGVWRLDRPGWVSAS